MSRTEVLLLPTRFDHSFHKQFTELTKTLLEREATEEIILDFSRVEYLNSSALGMMFVVHKQALAKGMSVKIRGAKGATEEILSVANMQKLFEFI